MKYEELMKLSLADRVDYLKRTYAEEIVEENDWFYYFDDFVVNIHDHDEDGVFAVVAYPLTEDGDVIWDAETEVRFESYVPQVILEEMPRFVVRNHNKTVLGRFDTRARANKEAIFYSAQTGNPAYVEDTQNV